VGRAWCGLRVVSAAVDQKGQSMTALLTPRFWICLALVAGLSFTHLFTYRAGKATVRAAWDKERAEQVQAALAESEARRMKEKALTITNEGITNAFIKEKARLVADSRATADRLRDLKASLDIAPGTEAAPLGGSDDPRGAIISQCATSLAILDNDFANLASKAKALQDYTREVCLAGQP